MRSRSRPGRPGHQRELARLVEDARRRRFGAVLVWSLDRLSREGALAILSLVGKLGVCGVRNTRIKERLSVGGAGEIIGVYRVSEQVKGTES